jgi:hypothetical protein
MEGGLREAGEGQGRQRKHGDDTQECEEDGEEGSHGGGPPFETGLGRDPPDITDQARRKPSPASVLS